MRRLGAFLLQLSVILVLLAFSTTGLCDQPDVTVVVGQFYCKHASQCEHGVGLRVTIDGSTADDIHHGVLTYKAPNLIRPNDRITITPRGSNYFLAGSELIKIYEVRRVDIHDEGDLRRIILPPIELSARQKILGSKDVLTEYYLKRTLAALHANQDPVLALEDLAFQGYRDLALSPQELRELTEASMKRAYAGYTSVVGDIPIQFRNPDLDTVFTPDFADRASKYNLRLQNRDQDTYNDLLKGLNNNLIKPTTLDELLFNPALAPEVHPGRRREYILELAPEKLSEAEVRRVENLPEVKQYILLRELSKPNQVNKELVERKLGELNKPTLVNVR